MSPPPLVILDYTLHDLYTSDTEESLDIVLVYYPLQFKHNDGNKAVKYAYGYNMEAEGDGATSSPLTMAASLVPQRYAFSAGRMPLVILNVPAQRKSNSERGGSTRAPPADPVPAYRHHHLDIHRTFAQLHADQRPSVCFASSPNRIELGLGTRIAILQPTDCVSHLPHLVCPDAHYEILSKRGLALSGLPTPLSRVIDTMLVDYEDHPSLLAKEIARITGYIEQYQVPFMVKLPQSISGMGTFAVTCESDRTRVVKALLSTRLEVLLRQLNQTNRHLHPCSIVLQDFVDGPVVALSMFVTKSTDQPIFIACCEQLFDNNAHWIGGTISYAQQAGFQKTFSTLMGKVADFLHRKGYHGPAGIDIVTDRHSGEQLVIDLNVRVTGTYHLGPLRGHFFTRRGLSEAAVTSGDFPCTRDEFEEAFSEEIHQGSLIVSGWVHEESQTRSHAAITVGATDRGSLQEYLRRIKAVGKQD
jgi:hypothetical protein